MVYILSGYPLFRNYFRKFIFSYLLHYSAHSKWIGYKAVRIFLLELSMCTFSLKQQSKEENLKNLKMLKLS